MSIKSDADKMAKEVIRIAVKQPERVAKGLYLEFQIELTESKKLVPVSPTQAQLKAMGQYRPKHVVPGALRASGQVLEPVVTYRTISCEISYGNASVPYAEVQHERLDFFHTNGQAKYLESVIDASVPYMAERIMKRIHFDKGSVPW